MIRRAAKESVEVTSTCSYGYFVWKWSCKEVKLKNQGACGFSYTTPLDHKYNHSF